MPEELAKVYEPKKVEDEVNKRWLEAGAFNAEPADPRAKYCIVIPPPNVTDALHLGHALNNTLQDVLIRYKRMCQFDTLWMPGTDHAGIATQTVVEKCILVEEGKRRTDFARDEFVARVQAWKDEYESRILGQLKTMGCSCDWRRTRFTMDEVCAAAVRAAFFKLFSDGLIYRGKRLVNWDPATQTVLADDEVEYEEVQGHFWYLRYPLLEPVVVPCGTRVPPVSGTRVPPVSGTDVSSVSSMGVSRMGELSIEKRQGTYLPHWTQIGATYVVTFRLGDSVPKEVAEAWKRQRQEVTDRAKRQNRELTYQERKELHKLHSARVESCLDAGHGSCCLREPKVAEAIQNSLKHFDGDRYELLAWAVMPNHVHAVVRPLGTHTLTDILHSWKSFAAKQANSILGHQGQLWQEEYYDHLIRDEEDFNNEVNYVVNNPAKAGLKDWPWCGMKRQGQDGPATHGQDARATVITHVTVATTRPETMLGDTAVAMNPTDPRAKHLLGKKVRLPIAGRIVPIIADEHVVLPDPESEDEKARYSTGFLKVTPAHDPDDYAIGQRHGLAMVNVMAPDGSISDRHGWDDCSPDAQFLLGMDRFEARQAIVEWFRKEDLLEDVRPYTHQVGHSYRSHVPIEPYLSDQWYIAVKKPIPNCRLPIANCQLNSEGVPLLPETDIPANSLAGLALGPLLDERLKFTPARYAATYRSWLENLRDWPISRQLWWGHQLPVWSRTFHLTERNWHKEILDLGLDHMFEGEWNGKVAYRVIKSTTGELVEHPDKEFFPVVKSNEGEYTVYVCPLEDSLGATWEKKGFTRDEDVLDTWFSSALWPFSTMGWPAKTAELGKYYPTDVLCTAREIITLWVTRMVMMGQYCIGDIPFTDVFIHAMIQDGEGRKMSKSLGNGIDPLDIIDSHGADAMRFTLVSMTTQTQDVRMPVEEMTLPDGRTCRTSPKFDVGRNFCNKLWNAARFAMMNLEGCPPWEDIRPAGQLADAWILSRLNGTIRDATAALEAFRFNELAEKLYHFMWDDFCDWYLEIAKGRINSGDAAPKAIVAHCLDVLLRLLHPIIPFITEAIWARLNEVAPVRGPGGQQAEPLLARAEWPRADAGAINQQAEHDFEMLADMIRQIRNARSRHNVPPPSKLAVKVEGSGPAASLVADNADLLKSQAGLSEVSVVEHLANPPADAAAVTAANIKLHVLGIIDRQAEVQRLTKQAETLRRGVQGIEAKLANEGFVSKAPPAVVQRERQRLAQLKADLEAVEKSLAALNG